jgi:UDP:flavonoid glycosyltransferase YjiC (YdhE family)
VVVVHAGVRVSKKISPEKLRRVISQALVDQSIKQGARAMAGALARSDGATVIANELERLQVHNAVQ